MRRARYRTRNPPRLMAFDTEARRGDLLLICSPNRHHEHDRRNRNGPQRTIDWLWKEARDTNFFYNLAYDRDVIFKPPAKRMKRGEHSVRCGPYRIKFLGNKSFALDRRGSHRRKRFFDIADFYSDGERHLPLEEVAQEFLGEGKLPDVDSALLGEENGYYEMHRREVIEYCQRDADLALKLGKFLVSELKGVFGFFPSRFNSKASLSKAWVEDRHPELFAPKRPRWKSLAWSSYRGGIFWTRILGRLERVTELDISSAYGDALRHLPRMRKLERRLSAEYHPEARLGAYRILVDYDGRLPLDPTLRRKRRGRARVLYPHSRGKLRPYVATKAEMDYFTRSRRSLRVLMAEEWFGEFEPQFPELEGLLEEIAGLKRKAEEGDKRAKIRRHLLKTVVNSLYGCLAESKFGETRLTNWPFAAEITGRTRAAIWREWDRIVRAGGAVVSVNTDSLRFVLPDDYDEIIEDFVLKHYHPPEEDGETQWEKGWLVGDFEPKFMGATVTHYQSGIAVIERKDVWAADNGWPPVLRKRGKPLLTVEMLRAATGPILKIPSRHVTHLFEGVAQDRRDEIGVFDDPSDEQDDTKLDLTSNQWAFDFDPDLLRFEVLNERAVSGAYPDFDLVTGGRFVGTATRRATETTRPADGAPASGRPRRARVRLHTGSA